MQQVIEIQIFNFFSLLAKKLISKKDSFIVVHIRLKVIDNNKKRMIFLNHPFAFDFTDPYDDVYIHVKITLIKTDSTTDKKEKRQRKVRIQNFRNLLLRRIKIIIKLQEVLFFIN